MDLGIAEKKKAAVVEYCLDLGLRVDVDAEEQKGKAVGMNL